MASPTGTLYTGVTNDLARRVYEHKSGLIPGFTSKYNITRLVFYEETMEIQIALTREKQIKGWRRKKKIHLIESLNPKWEDLSEGWYEEAPGMTPNKACHSENPYDVPINSHHRRDSSAQNG